MSDPHLSKLPIAINLLTQQRNKAIDLLKERYDNYTRFSDNNKLKPKFTSSDLSDSTFGISFPINDCEVKDWYITTISIFEATVGKTDECLKRMKKLRKDLLFDDIDTDSEFNTFDSGRLLDYSIELLNDCIESINYKDRDF